MHNKFEVKANVFNFISYIKNHFSTTVKTIRTVNGIEFAT